MGRIFIFYPESLQYLNVTVKLSFSGLLSKPGSILYGTFSDGLTTAPGGSNLPTFNPSLYPGVEK